MTGTHSGPNDEERGDHVELDIYGLKAKGRAGDLGEPQPTTMREALRQIRGHLLRILVAPTRLVAETLEGVTRLVRGTSAVPGALAARVQAARVRADQREDQRQEAAESEWPRRLLSEAMEAERAAEVRRLQDWMGRVRGRVDNGRVVDADMVDLGDGRLLALAGVPPDERAAIEAATARTMRQLANNYVPPPLSESHVATLQRVAVLDRPFVVERTGAPEAAEEEAALMDLAGMGYVVVVDATLAEQAPTMTPFVAARITGVGSLLLRELADGRPVGAAQMAVADAVRVRPELATTAWGSAAGTSNL